MLDGKVGKFREFLDILMLIITINSTGDKANRISCLKSQWNIFKQYCFLGWSIKAFKHLKIQMRLIFCRSNICCKHLSIKQSG